MSHSRRQSRPPPKYPLPARSFGSALSCLRFLCALLLLYADSVNCYLPRIAADNGAPGEYVIRDSWAVPGNVSAQ